ncbi:alpha/beta hydrolase family protein [Pseudozobellia thermophila]|uniref:PhoPQ-activated pathogenicity-related protein n=1 Tax=Pseudozobellia thermophila TaxID=192903 RepID=A0A1M6G1M7_9FLAO|nr:acetylxylan esterase [Pseudozobellia thermophila]SHJ03804.1 PhoPQ-activated pathogenicity-related protein [Pseudozobellia thermophila]
MRLPQLRHFAPPALAVLLLGMGIVVGTRPLGAQGNATSDGDGQRFYTNTGQGPMWVKDRLIQNGALQTPEYYFTREFDDERSGANIKGLFFDGLAYKGKPTKVFAWYGEPENLEKGAKVPAVVLVHGGGGTAFVPWVKKWTDRGYIAMSIALEGQIPGAKIEGENGKKQYRTFEHSGPRRQGFFEDVVVTELEDQWFFHAVADAMLATSLLKDLPNVDGDKIGITGISWGGILTNVITGVDNRYAFAIPVYGCGFLQETPNYSRLLSKLDKEQRDFYLRNWEPSLYVPHQRQPTLFVNGTNDFHFTMNSFTKTFEASPNEKYLYIEHNMKHGHQAGWTPESIYAFADYITKNTTPPDLPKEMLKKGRKRLRCRYQGDIDAAFLYYTTDTGDWGKDNYQWVETPAQVSDTQKTISAKLPEKAVAYFVNVINSDGIMYSSPMKMPGAE